MGYIPRIRFSILVHVKIFPKTASIQECEHRCVDCTFVPKKRPIFCDTVKRTGCTIAWRPKTSIQFHKTKISNWAWNTLYTKKNDSCEKYDLHEWFKLCNLLITYNIIYQKKYEINWNYLSLWIKRWKRWACELFAPPPKSCQQKPEKLSSPPKGPKRSRRFWTVVLSSPSQWRTGAQTTAPNA